jgi:hypothetical protein
MHLDAVNFNGLKRLPNEIDRISTTIRSEHLGGDENQEDLLHLTVTEPNTQPNVTVDEPDAVCGTVSVNVSAGASEFFKTLGSYLKTMFRCLYLAYKGWAHDGWKLSALKKNRRWLYIMLSILFLVLIIVIIVVIITAATGSTSRIKGEIARAKQQKEAEAAKMRANVQRELASTRSPAAHAAVPPPTYGYPYSNERPFDYGASSTYRGGLEFSPHASATPYQGETGGGSF